VKTFGGVPMAVVESMVLWCTGRSSWAGVVRFTGRLLVAGVLRLAIPAEAWGGWRAL